MSSISEIIIDVDHPNDKQIFTPAAVLRPEQMFSHETPVSLHRSFTEIFQAEHGTNRPQLTPITDRYKLAYTDSPTQSSSESESQSFLVQRRPGQSNL